VVQESIENLILQPFEVETQTKLKLEISEERKNSNFIEFLKHQDEFLTFFSFSL